MTDWVKNGVWSVGYVSVDLVLKVKRVVGYLVMKAGHCAFLALTAMPSSAQRDRRDRG